MNESMNSISVSLVPSTVLTLLNAGLMNCWLSEWEREREKEKKKEKEWKEGRQMDEWMNGCGIIYPSFEGG